MSDRPDSERFSAGETDNDGVPHRAAATAHVDSATEVATLIDQISHDLRSALNGIQSWAYVLDQSLDAPPPPAQRALTGLRTAMEQQIGLIQHLEESVRLLADDSPADWQRTDLATTLSQAIEALRPSAAARQITLTDVAVVPATDADVANDAVVVAERRWLEPMVRQLLVHCLRQARNGDTLQAQLHMRPDRVRLMLTESRANAERAQERLSVLADFFRRHHLRAGTAPARHSSALLLARRLGELLGAQFGTESCGLSDGADQYGVCISVDFFRQPALALLAASQSAPPAA